MKAPTGTTPQTTHERVDAIAAILDDMQAAEIVVMDMEGVCDFTEAFIVATVRSSTHMRATYHRVLEQMRETGLRAINKAERDHENWALIDYSDVIVHLFEREAREYYNLEGLWADADIRPWSDQATA